MRRSRKPLSKRQQRKAEARRKVVPFQPILGATNRYGSRYQRRYQYAVIRGCVDERWRVKKQLRGEYYGRKLERLIRSGAPLASVRAERKIIRALLKA